MHEIEHYCSVFYGLQKFLLSCKCCPHTLCMLQSNTLALLLADDAHIGHLAMTSHNMSWTSFVCPGLEQLWLTCSPVFLPSQHVLSSLEPVWRCPLPVMPWWLSSLLGFPPQDAVASWQRRAEPGLFCKNICKCYADRYSMSPEWLQHIMHGRLPSWVWDRNSHDMYRCYG